MEANQTKRIASRGEAAGQAGNRLRELLRSVTGRSALPYIMVAPAILILFIFIICPMIYTFFLSLFKWNMIEDMKFVGLDNFIKLFSSPESWNTFGNTFYYMIVNVVFSIVLSLLMALYLKNSSFFKRILQSIAFVPHIMAGISVAFIWAWIMNTEYGLLNFLLGLAGVDPVRWLEDPEVAMNSLILVSVWKGLGYNSIILISAMRAVPTHIYEAAALDKGRKLGVFFKITLPMISPTLFFIALMDIIACFKVFETVKVMTRGSDATITLVYDIYQYGVVFYDIGYASALGVVCILLIGVCTLLYFRLLSKRVHYR